MRIRREAIAAVIAHARAECPRECCGILVGRVGFIEEVVRANNIADRPTRFLIDPKDHILARRYARDRGREVLGFYHSHTRSPAWPSESDVDAAAAYPDAFHMIVSLAETDADVRLFRIERDLVAELPLIPMNGS
jgi:proteasome lid subunit RPN8/RPN11